MISQGVHEKLAKVMGMLGSSSDGERASAARIATVILKQCGMTWADVAAALRPPVQPSAAPKKANNGYQRQPAGFQPVHVATANDLLGSWPELLSDWETTFLRSIRNRPRLSRKQDETLTRIYQRVQGHASAL